MIAEIEAALLDRVRSLVAPLGIAAEPFPDGPGGYTMTHQRGVVLVVNAGARYDPPDRTHGAAQRRTLAFDLVLLARGLRGPDGAYPALDALARGLAGWEAPGCLPARLSQEQFVGHDASVWTWRMGVEMTTWLVPAPQKDEHPYGAPLVRAAVKTESDDPMIVGEQFHG
jgi:hypothetical protein